MRQDGLRYHVRFQNNDPTGRRQGVRSNPLGFDRRVRRFFRQEDGRSTRSCSIRLFASDHFCGLFNERRRARICGFVIITYRSRQRSILSGIIRITLRHDCRRLSNATNAFFLFYLGVELGGDCHFFRDPYDFRCLQRRRFSQAGRISCVIRAYRRQSFSSTRHVQVA